MLSQTNEHRVLPLSKFLKLYIYTHLLLCFYGSVKSTMTNKNNNYILKEFSLKFPLYNGNFYWNVLSFVPESLHIMKLTKFGESCILCSPKWGGTKGKNENRGKSTFFSTFPFLITAAILLFSSPSNQASHLLLFV